MNGQTTMLLTTDEVAAELGVKATTVQAWRKEGKGPAYIKISRRLVRYRRSDVQAWVDGQKVVVQQTSAETQRFSVPQPA